MDGTDVKAIKQIIWQEANQNLYTVNVAKSNIGLAHSDTLVPYTANKLLQEVRRLKRTPIQLDRKDLKPVAQPAITEHDYRARYYAAHEQNFKEQYPQAFRDGHYARPPIPKLKTSNGLTIFIIYFLTWSGYRATRINVTGRVIRRGGKDIRIKSSTRRGAADISSTINGRSVQWEIKAGNDRPSEAQLLEQRRERRAGGEYFFVHNTDEFFSCYDSIVYGT